MLGQRSPQKSLFEADTQFLEFVGRDSFYAFLASRRGQLFRDEDFAGLYNPTFGRPSVPPSLLATALVLQTYDGVSDDEARRRATYDLQWKVALGVELDATPFAKSTLQEFRAQLVLHDEQRAIFERTLELAKKRGHFKGGRKLKLALDTTNILGQGAVKDTYNLLADGIVLVLRALAQQAGATLVEYAVTHGYGRYVEGASLKGQAEVDWQDAAARRRFLAGIVADADRLLEEVRRARGRLKPDSPEERRLEAAAGLLSRVLVQDIERREDGPDLREGVARDRMPSVHDPEMRHGRKSKAKRFDGHKLQLAVDTESQLITDVAVLPGNAPDREQALSVVEESEALTGCQVEETLGDTAYGDGATRRQFADAGRKLIAKAPPISNQGYFAKTAFEIDLEAQTCRCPAGQLSHDLRPRAKGGGVFRFATGVCAACPLRPQCVRGRGGRSVQVHAQEALLQEARLFQRSPAFRAAQALRQVAEHRLARMVQLGIRQARYRGTAKTLFQAFMAATVANLTLLAAGSGAWLPLLVTLTGLIAALLSRRQPAGRPNWSSVTRQLDHPNPVCLTVSRPKMTYSRPDF